MKKLITSAAVLITLTVLISLSSCMLTEPSMFIIDNKSPYQIEVNITALDKSLSVKKNKSEVIIAYPQTIELEISIPQINYSKNVTFELNYMEKKRVEFDIHE